MRTSEMSNEHLIEVLINAAVRFGSGAMCIDPSREGHRLRTLEAKTELLRRLSVSPAAPEGESENG